MTDERWAYFRKYGVPRSGWLFDPAEVAELLSEADKFRAALTARDEAVKVSIGTSVLSRDLIWCECGRGLSIPGKWDFCPRCGHPIDQASYEEAVALAVRNSATTFRYRDADDAELIGKLTRDISARDEAIRVATEAISQVSANGWTVADRIDALRDAAFERDSSRAGDWECCCSVCCDYRTLIIEFQLADAIRKARTALAALKETPDA